MKHKSGSIIVTSLLVTLGVLALLTTVYNVVLLYADVAAQKKKFEQQKWYALGATNCAIALTKNNFENLQTECASTIPFQIEVRFSEQPKDTRVAFVDFTKKDTNILHVETKVIDPTGTLCVSCDVEKEYTNGNNTVFVSNWKIGEK